MNKFILFFLVAGHAFCETETDRAIKIFSKMIDRKDSLEKIEANDFAGFLYTGAQVIYPLNTIGTTSSTFLSPLSSFNWNQSKNKMEVTSGKHRFTLAKYNLRIQRGIPETVKTPSVKVWLGWTQVGSKLVCLLWCEKGLDWYEPRQHVPELDTPEITMADLAFLGFDMDPYHAQYFWPEYNWTNAQ